MKKIVSVTYARQAGGLYAVVNMPEDKILEFIALAARRGELLTVESVREF